MDWVDRIGRRVKLRDLHVLLAVTQWGSMAKAARYLATSQPVISKTIAELEHALGVRLLDRSPQGIVPTMYGRALMSRGLAIFDELREGIKEIEFLADPAAGELRIGCTEAGAAGFVPAVIGRLSQRYPRVVFRVVTADAVSLVERELPQRKVELAIGAVPGPLSAGDIEATILFDDRHFVMAGERNKWVRRRNIKLAELVQEPWILPPPDSLMGLYIAEAFRGDGLEPPHSQVVSFSIPLCHHLLATGRFLTMHPVVMARLGKYLPLKRLDVDFAGIPRPVGVMVLKNRTLSPLARLFIDCAHEMAKPLAKHQ